MVDQQEAYRQCTNVFIVIPTGKDTTTFPLRNLGGVKTKTQFKFWNLLGGVILVMIGLKYFIFLIFGAVLIVSAFQTVISVGAAGGGGTIYSYLPWEAASAKKMINELNQLIANI